MMLATLWSREIYGLEMHSDARKFLVCCPECQRMRNINVRSDMPLKYNLKWILSMHGELISWVHFLILMDMSKFLLLWIMSLHWN